VQPPKDTLRKKYSKQYSSTDEQIFNIFRHIVKGRDANNTFAKSLKSTKIKIAPDDNYYIFQQMLIIAIHFLLGF